MIYNMCNMVDSVIWLIVRKRVRKRVSWHVQGNSWYQSVCRVSLTVSVYINIIIKERIFSPWNQSLPLKIVSIKVQIMMSCLSSDFRTLVQILQLLLGRVVRLRDSKLWCQDFQSHFLSPEHLHTDKERHGRRDANFWGRCNTLRKKNPETASERGGISLTHSQWFEGLSESPLCYFISSTCLLGQ